MEELGKKKKPYRGMLIPFILMVAVPIPLYFLFYYVLNTVNNTPQMAHYMALAFAGLAGVCFDLMCVICGLFSDLFEFLIIRIKLVFYLYKPFEKGSAKFYFSEFIRGAGPLLWLYLILIGVTIGVTAYGMYNFLSAVL